MVNFLYIILATIFVTIVGGGIAYLIYVQTRPKKEVWKAKVYQLGEGVTPPKTDKDGNILSDISLKDLIPYARDKLEKVEKAHGVIIYRLQKLNKATPAVESGVVDYWGKDYKEVNVLLHKGGCTLLKKGYDFVGGGLIFNPLSHSRINLIKSEMAIRKDRLQKEKDILQAITPWVVAGIMALALVAIAYVMISGFVKISDNLESSVEKYNELIVKPSQVASATSPVSPGTPATRQPLGSQNNGSIT